jgi:hypothetical protein
MVIESGKKKNILISIIFLVVGLIFLYFTAKVENPNRNQRAAFYLGLLLSSLSGLALINQDERTTEVDSNSKRFIYTRNSLIGGKEVRVVPFDQVKKVGVTRVGRRGPIPTQSYFIYIQLVNGRTIRTGYSSFDEYGTKELAAEMAHTIGCEHSPTPIAPLDIEMIENAIYQGLSDASGEWIILFTMVFIFFTKWIICNVFRS